MFINYTFVCSTILFFAMLNFLLSMPNATELILIVGAILLLFGGKKIPELMRGLGRGIREFNDAKDGVRQELQKTTSIETEVKATNTNDVVQVKEKTLKDSVPHKA